LGRYFSREVLSQRHVSLDASLLSCVLGKGTAHVGQSLSQRTGSPRGSTSSRQPKTLNRNALLAFGLWFSDVLCIVQALAWYSFSCSPERRFYTGGFPMTGHLGRTDVSAKKRIAYRSGKVSLSSGVSADARSRRR
jgi:hypothetical protein